MSQQPALPFASPTTPAGTDGVLIHHLAGERVELQADRALYWPRAATLFVADVHLGKAAAFRAGGVPMPRGGTQADLDRLAALLAFTSARRLVVLGDFLHAQAGRVAALDIAFRRWREQHGTIQMTLVRGNHDTKAGDPPTSWSIDVVQEPHALAPFLACHLPVSPPTGYALCGHVHPGVRIGGRAGQSERLPCFVLGSRRAILPAFGGFTGLALQRPQADERIVAVAGKRLFALANA
jgi:DNA ligase-associated metallophosphoesterase